MTYTAEDLAEFAEVIRVLERARAADATQIVALTAEATQAHALNAQLQRRVEELEARLGGHEPRAGPPRLRPELDGSLLIRPEGGSVWLVFHGRRHEIAGAEVFDGLFAPDRAPTVSGAIDGIVEGRPLRAGDRLVRARGALRIFLRRNVGRVLLHAIPSWDDFLDFRFEEAKVEEIDGAELDRLSRGHDLTSAGHRPGDAAHLTIADSEAVLS